MKWTLAVASILAVLVGAGVGLAATLQERTLPAVVLRPGQAVSYSGLTCTAYAGTSPTNANLVCVRNNLAGFGVVVSQQTIIIAKRSGTKVRVVFKTNNR